MDSSDKSNIHEGIFSPRSTVSFKYSFLSSFIGVDVQRKFYESGIKFGQAAFKGFPFYVLLKHFPSSLHVS